MKKAKPSLGMLLRAVRQLAPRKARGLGGGAPLVKDSLIAITAVTQDGRRFPVLGRAGTSLADALAGCQWQAVVGRMATLSCSWGSEAHVRIAHEWLDKVPAPDTQGLYDLDLLADGVASDSRLASKARPGCATPHFASSWLTRRQVTLSPAMNGMTVALAELHPSATY